MSKFKVGDKVSYIGELDPYKDLIYTVKEVSMNGKIIHVDTGLNMLVFHHAELILIESPKSVCSHEWKSTPGFMLNTVYVDCSKCGIKQEDYKDETTPKTEAKELINDLDAAVWRIFSTPQLP